MQSLCNPKRTEGWCSSLNSDVHRPWKIWILDRIRLYWGLTFHHQYLGYWYDQSLGVPKKNHEFNPQNKKLRNFAPGFFGPAKAGWIAGFFVSAKEQLPEVQLPISCFWRHALSCHWTILFTIHHPVESPVERTHWKTQGEPWIWDAETSRNWRWCLFETTNDNGIKHIHISLYPLRKCKPEHQPVPHRVFVEWRGACLQFFFQIKHYSPSPVLSIALEQIEENSWIIASLWINTGPTSSNPIRMSRRVGCLTWTDFP